MPGGINAKVIESREKGLLLKAGGKLWGVTPIRPFRAGAAGLLAPKVGATYSAIRLLSVADRPAPSAQ